jgi:predicted transcriptional regulator
MSTRSEGKSPSASTTLTVRLPPEVKDRLGELAARTQRTKSFLAGEAIAGYVARELEIIEAIQQGLEDMRAGRVVPHEEAMQRIRATIARASKDSESR